MSSRAEGLLRAFELLERGANGGDQSFVTAQLSHHINLPGDDGADGPRTLVNEAIRLALMDMNIVGCIHEHCRRSLKAWARDLAYEQERVVSKLREAGR